MNPDSLLEPDSLCGTRLTVSVRNVTVSVGTMTVSARTLTKRCFLRRNTIEHANRDVYFHLRVISHYQTGFVVLSNITENTKYVLKFSAHLRNCAKAFESLSFSEVFLLTRSASFQGVE
jgi:hypothetical protein